MLGVLLVARLLDVVENTLEHVHVDDVVLYGATSLDEVRRIITLHQIDVMVVGAGIELSERLAIVRAAFELSDTITVHMKDKASGADGFLPFAEEVIAVRQREG